MMFKDIVLNKKAYARDRLATFEKLGKLAEVMGDDEKPASVIPPSLLENASKILLAIEYNKVHPEIAEQARLEVEYSAVRSAEVIDVEPRKQWI